MDQDTLRAYLLAPSRDGSPAIEAARLLLAERDALAERVRQQAAQLARLCNTLTDQEKVAAELRDMRDERDPLLREVERLRAEVQQLTPAPWETDHAPETRDVPEVPPAGRVGGPHQDGPPRAG